MQQGDQVLDVGASQTERVDLGELPIGGVSGHELPELVEGRVDGVHPLSLSAVGRYSLHLARLARASDAVPALPRRVVVVGLGALASVGAATAGASACRDGDGAVGGVRVMPVLCLIGAAGGGAFGAGPVLLLMLVLHVQLRRTRQLVCCCGC